MAFESMGKKKRSEQRNKKEKKTKHCTLKRKNDFIICICIYEIIFFPGLFVHCILLLYLREMGSRRFFDMIWIFAFLMCNCDSNVFQFSFALGMILCQCVFFCCCFFCDSILSSSCFEILLLLLSSFAQTLERPSTCESSAFC